MYFHAKLLIHRFLDGRVSAPRILQLLVLLFMLSGVSCLYQSAKAEEGKMRYFKNSKLIRVSMLVMLSLILLGCVLFLAVPMITAQQVLSRPELMSKDVHPSQPTLVDKPEAVLGVMGKIVFLVEHVEADTPAARAGLKAGDMIVGIDGNQIHCLDDFTLPVWKNKPGKKFKLHYLRIDETTKEPVLKEAEVPSIPWREPAKPPQMP